LIVRARQKITSHFRRRCIPPDCVAKILNMLDIHAFSRLVSRALQHLKLRIYFLPNPKFGFTRYKIKSGR
ncbi:MAG: hypothetical protein U9R02_07400, partial [Thermodesulfobacteriota bacterium]|nr:hypothetical protein [Thermodesulfobacteriota bacterium]